MKYTKPWMSITAIWICLIVPKLCFAQASLQEIVRFDIPFGHRFVEYVDAGGDLNGDGRPDLVIGCSLDSGTLTTNTYIYYSMPDSNAVPDQIYNANEPICGASTGWAIAYAGDLNGDGISDLVTGSMFAGYGHEGVVTISFGGNPPFTTPDVFINSTGLGYTHDWALYFGEKVITHCDVNGDGINDLLVYASGPQMENWGNVFVYLGGDPFGTTPVLHIRGAVMEERLGINMQAGDINGDGYDDIILTNRVPLYPQGSDNTVLYYLKIYPGGETLSNVPIVDVLLGSSIDIGVGKLVANGDLNGDGYDDIVIPGRIQNGQSWLKVFYGQEDITSLQSVDLELDYYSYSITSYVNLNNDPFSDLWVKLHQPMPYDPYEGSYAVYKQTSELFDCIPDFVDHSPVPRSTYGWCYPIGDMNNDGFPDFFVYSYAPWNPPGPAYGTILSESYVSNSDAYLPVAPVKVSAYPNPFRDRLNLRLSTMDKSVKAEYINVYNTKGQLVYHKALPKATKTYWDGRDKSGNIVSNGVYLIKLGDHKGRTYTAKVVKIM